MKSITRIITCAAATVAMSLTVLAGSALAADTEHMYRLYNPNSGEHFYTASIAERDATVAAGWTDEGLAWDAPKKSNTPVYRLYSKTDHHYTMSAHERDTLIAAGWEYEGIGWYSDDSKIVPLYRQYNPNVQPWAPTNNSGSHNYTTSKGENDDLVRAGWHEEGVGWYGCVHTHSFDIPVYSSVYHDAVVQEVRICHDCGAQNPSYDHLENHGLNGGIGGTYSSVQTISPAYTEQVISGCKCSCGAVK